MSKKKRLTLNTDRLIHMTKGKEYEVEYNDTQYYLTTDNVGDQRQINKDHFDELRPKKKKKPKKQKGLTKREYFAAKAMNGLLSKGMGGYDNLATWAVQYADQLIEELNKKKVNE